MENNSLQKKKTFFNFKFKKSYLGFFLVLVSLLMLDQSTKYFSEKSFMIGSSSTDIHTYLSRAQHVFTVGSNANWLDFSLTYVRNTGAAWGFLGNMPESIRPFFFYILTAVVMLLILLFFFKTKADQVLVRLGIVLIFSGALGNFIDRLNLHYVIDWIHVQWKIFGWNYDYPVFNIADSAIVSGVILLILDACIDSFKARKLKKIKEN